MEQVDADVGNIFEKLDTWLDGFFRLLPNIAVALAVLVFFILLGIFAARLARRSAAKNNRESLGEVSGALLKWAIFIFGAAFAVTIVAPSISMGDLMGGLGVSSVAIGFAFKDILQNMLAGVLILLRRPFQVGDEIVSGGHTGKVEKIETRATFIRTYDGRVVVIPNSDIYTDAVVVITANESIRSQYDIGIGCNDDWDLAKKLMIEGASACEGVLSDPAPEAIPIAIADSSNNIRLRWWTKSDRASVIHTFGNVIETVYKKLDDAGIDMPYPTQMVLLHDQTEEVDGNRDKQREGWPTPKGETTPTSAMAARARSGQDGA